MRDRARNREACRRIVKEAKAHSGLYSHRRKRKRRRRRMAKSEQF
jgi:hypothetical protein